MQQPRPPVLIGGHGHEAYARALAARYADEFNLPVRQSVEDTAAQFDRVRAACAAIGRDPAAWCYSNALVLCCGRTRPRWTAGPPRSAASRDELRAQRPGRHARPRSSTRSAGTPRLGASRIYLQVLDLADLDHLDLVAAEVMPQL